MKVAVFSAKEYDKSFLCQEASGTDVQFTFFDTTLNKKTVSLAEGYDAVNCFVNDTLDAEVLRQLKTYNVSHASLRCAGFNNVELHAAKKLGITVTRVPAYSPESVAEHTFALLLSLNRKIHKAYNRVKENNFTLQGLMGFNLHGKTVGVIGTGKIGKAVIRICQGFGCNVLCYDPYPCSTLQQQNVEYVELDTLFTHSDIISLHCPLTTETQHLINQESIAKMKDSAVLINTSRGGLVDTKAIIAALKTKKIGGLALDVYEMESELFFQDLSCEIIQDDVFQRLLTFPNVVITGHQGFFTQEALKEIAQTTLNNLINYPQGKLQPDNIVQL
ncbi:2-hydroxyacid dehydrogenase [Planctobacterium marinum]|uniref:Lactate dehydrogenase n=1 Tax=Planctobacterium marinum TaxID=1631968 RepID=A0AA48KP75_9ALTE|nr:lactate dehydrogenase [Planctobacterium marinum]